MAEDEASPEALRERAQSTARALGVPDEPPPDSDLRELTAEYLRALADAGLLDLGFLSGQGLGAGDIERTAAIVEGLARESGALASIFTVNTVFGGGTVALLGTPEQRSAMLPRLARGRLQLAFALTEPGAGSDAAALETRAEAGDGGYVVNGEKLYTTGAMTADRILVVAKTGDADAEGREFSVFLLPPDAEGITVEPMEKLAGNIQPSCRVLLDGVRVPADALLGGEAALGRAWNALRTTGALERLMVSASCLGSGWRILEEAKRFAAERRQFGRRIAGFQAVSHRLVEMDTAVRVMRLLVGEAVRCVEQGDNPAIPVCTAKYVCAEKLQWMAESGMRIVGGRAYLADSPLARIYREAPLALYAGGTVEIQKNLISRALGL